MNNDLFDNTCFEKHVLVYNMFETNMYICYRYGMVY